MLSAIAPNGTVGPDDHRAASSAAEDVKEQKLGPVDQKIPYVEIPPNGAGEESLPKILTSDLRREVVIGQSVNFSCRIENLGVSEVTLS